jgi:GNAT superfamily N-acetyltransferase
LTRPKTKKAPFNTRIMPAVLRQLKKVGIHLNPFFTVREGDSRTELSDSDEFRFDFIAENEFDSLVTFERTVDRSTLRSWLDSGKRCFSVWDNDKLIATMWCDFDEFNFAPNYRPLATDEVYLYAAYSDPRYRGRNVAPNMRQRCYAALRELGCSRFYSYTQFFNVAARRFKEKLGARNEQLRLNYCLFGRWSNTVTLRTYQ